ncbi:hypothetical protein HDU76_012553 [Blyttiomyces sp. JEL0837]|nr:hypothetical protein HDU76_012553 [Blyttiomyces sp. JEL0837]
MMEATANDNNDPYIVIVTYQDEDTAIETRSPSLTEFKNELCMEFNWTANDLESIRIVHEGIYVKSPSYFENTLKSSRAANQYAKFVLKPKGTPTKPPTFPTSEIVPSPAVTSDVIGKNSFDVMISYDWGQGKPLALEIDRKLQEKNFKVWFDEREMRGNMYERMAEGVMKSKVITAILTIGYTQSQNCKYEISYAATNKKPIKPARFLQKDETLPPSCVALITSGLLYYDFGNAINDPQKFNTVFESLCHDIRKSIEELQDGILATTPPPSTSSDPLVEWLKPIDFQSEMKKFEEEYVPNTRMWAVKEVGEWLTEKTTPLLWMNGGAGLGKSMIAHLVSKNLPPGFVLGSLIFCKHDDNIKNNAIRIVATIAFDLASKSPEYRAFLTAQLENNVKNTAEGTISVLDMPSTAFEHFIIAGLRQIHRPLFNTVIIIDGLNEIGKQGDPIRADFLDILRVKMNDLPNWVRVFTTSRPHFDIYAALKDVNCSVLSPRDNHNFTDIMVFVRHYLSTRLLVEGEMDRSILTELVACIATEAAGVFQYARLACQSLTERLYKSSYEVLSATTEIVGGLDQMYERVLKEAFDGCDAGVLERFRKVIGVVVTAQEPLLIDCIARLVGLTSVEVGGIVLRFTENIPNQITCVAAWISESDEEMNIAHRDVLLDIVMWLWNFETEIRYNPLNIYSIATVNHFDSRRTIWVLGVDNWTLNDFKVKVATALSLEAETLTLSYKDVDGNFSKVVTEEAFSSALQVTRVFVVANTPLKPAVEIGNSKSLPSDGATKYDFDVMLSYFWNDEELAVKIENELKRRGLRVYGDSMSPTLSMYERMVHGVPSSLIILPLFTVSYGRSANCKRELMYAVNLNKHIIPISSLKPTDKLEPWTKMVAAGNVVYNLYVTWHDDVKFATSMDLLFSAIVGALNDFAVSSYKSTFSYTGGVEINQSSVATSKVAEPKEGEAGQEVISSESFSHSPPTSSSSDRLVQWLQPIDFRSDMEKFKGEYVKNTRLWAITEIHQWLQDNTNSLLWLMGSAGLGKSILAYLASQNMPHGYILGSVSFCKHDDDTTKYAIRMVSTIAFDLANKLHQYRDFLISQMDNNSNANISDMPSTAFERLIINGLREIRTPAQSVVIIIDALDQVGKQGDPIRDDFLQLIRDKMSHLPSWVRVFITSRPEPDIFKALHSVNCMVLLPDDKNNLDDINVFVKHQLTNKLSVNEEMDKEKLAHLVECIANEVSGIFQNARLVCDALTETSYQSWDEVLHLARDFDGVMDKICLRVLNEALDGADRTAIGQFQKVMGVVVTAQEPLHQDIIAKLAGLTSAEVGGIVLKVRAILNINNGVVNVLHKSLKDFFSSPDRCMNTNFRINTTVVNTSMATSSLQSMTTELFCNMANLKDGTLPFAASIKFNAINPYLAYCCKFWMSHLLVTRDSSLLPSINVFCLKSLRHWIEALALLGCLTDDISIQLKEVSEWISECDDLESGNDRKNTAQDMLRDCAVWLGRFKVAILENPLNIYYIEPWKGISSTSSVTSEIEFDVMLSYSLNDKELVLKIKNELEARGLRVFFEEAEMQDSLNERMAETILKSSYFIPVLTVGYMKSTYCKRQLLYAAEQKRGMIPIQALKPTQKLETWAKLLTDGHRVYDLGDALEDPIKFDESFDSLYSTIEQSRNLSKVNWEEYIQNYIGRIRSGSSSRDLGVRQILDEDDEIADRPPTLILDTSSGAQNSPVTTLTTDTKQRLRGKINRAALDLNRDRENVEYCRPVTQLGRSRDALLEKRRGGTMLPDEGSLSTKEEVEEELG